LNSRQYPTVLIQPDILYLASAEIYGKDISSHQRNEIYQIPRPGFAHVATFGLSHNDAKAISTRGRSERKRTVGQQGGHVFRGRDGLHALKERWLTIRPEGGGSAVMLDSRVLNLAGDSPL